MAIGDIYYDKTTVILRGDSFTDLSIKKNLVVPNGGAAITTGHGSSTQTGSAIFCGTTSNAFAPNTVSIFGNTLDNIGTGDFTIEIAFYTASFNASASTLLEWGLRDLAANLNSFDVSYSADSVALEYLNGTTATYQVSSTVTNQFATNQWIYLTIIRSNGVLYTYKGNTLLNTDSTNTTSTALNSTSKTLQLFASGTSIKYNEYGASAYCGGLRITRASRPAPSTSTFALFPIYAGQISGTITESLAITSWTITGVSASGLVCSTISTGTTYTLDCPSIEPYTLTCSPTINSIWKATTSVSLNYLICPTNPDSNPVLYQCTTAGTTGATEPAFSGATYTDGSVVWTKVGSLVDPVSLGAKIPS